MIAEVSALAINLRKSSNGKRAVSKTVNVGSIPAFRACYKKIASVWLWQLLRPDVWRKISTIEKTTTNMKFVENLKESYTELVHKVSWPTRKELSKSAVLVLIASIILALIVWLMDFSFESIMTFVYGLF